MGAPTHAAGHGGGGGSGSGPELRSVEWEAMLHCSRLVHGDWHDCHAMSAVCARAAGGRHAGHTLCILPTALIALLAPVQPRPTWTK